MKRLKERFADDFEIIRVRAECDLYPQVIEDWRSKHPLSVPDLGSEL